MSRSSEPCAEPFPRELTTDRLRLVAADTTSVDPFELYEHCRESAPGVERVTRYLTWEPYGTVNGAFEFLDTCESDFESGEAAHYAVFVGCEPETGEFAGMAGLGVEWDRRLATLGTWLREPFWGRGYSGERARALMRVAFDRLDLEAVAVTCQPRTRGPVERSGSTSRRRAAARRDSSANTPGIRTAWPTRTGSPSPARSGRRTSVRGRAGDSR